MKKFEDIQVWQKSKELVKLCYHDFKNNKDYNFKDQICRAAVSVMNNIAEGFERASNNEFRKFLFIARGSCGEFRSMLYIARDLKYINNREFDILYSQSLEISKMIFGLIKVLK